MTTLQTHDFTWDMSKHQHLRITTESSEAEARMLFANIKNAASGEGITVETFSFHENDNAVDDYKRILELNAQDNESVIMVDMMNPTKIKDSSWIISALYHVIISGKKNVHIVILSLSQHQIYLPPLLVSLTSSVLVGRFSERASVYEAHKKSLMVSDIEQLKKNNDALMWNGRQVDMFSIMTS